MTICITIKELNKVDSFRFKNMEDPLISKKIDNFNWSNAAVSISVKSFKSCFECEVSDTGKSLSCNFQVFFSVTYCNQKVFKFLF